MSATQKVQVRRRRSREEIERLIVEFETSGLQPIEFCRNRGLPPSTLQRHLRSKRWRLGDVQSKNDNRVGAAAMAGTHRNGNAQETCALEVVLAGGRRINVRPDFDSDTLKRLLSVLERR